MSMVLLEANSPLSFALAETGTIETLLDYFQVGYTSGTWHLPSIATKYMHDIEEKLATLLNKKLKPHLKFIAIIVHFVLTIYIRAHEDPLGGLMI